VGPYSISILVLFR